MSARAFAPLGGLAAERARGLAEAVRGYRESARLTTSMLAGRIGVRPGWYIALEAGEIDPQDIPPALAMRLLQTTGFLPSELGLDSPVHAPPIDTSLIDAPVTGVPIPPPVDDGAALRPAPAASTDAARCVTADTVRWITGTRPWMVGMDARDAEPWDVTLALQRSQQRLAPEAARALAAELIKYADLAELKP